MDDDILEIEKTCLGSILIKNSLKDDVFGIIKPEDFIDERNISIAKYLCKENHDILTLTAKLKRDSMLDISGGVGYVSQLIDTIGSTSNVVEYAKIIREKANLRAIERLSYNIRNYTQELDSNESMGRILADIREIEDQNIKGDYTNLNDEMEKAVTRMADNFEKGIKDIGIQTNFKNLDSITSGLYDGNFIVIGGRPATGKSTFALSMMVEMATHNTGTDVTGKQHYGAGFFSLEMSNKELIGKILSYRSGVDGKNIRSSTLTSQDFPRMFQAVKIMQDWTVFLDDNAGLTLTEICAKSRRMVRDGAKVIFIDYLQLINGQGKTEPREQFVSGLARGLKKLAKELQIPVVALTQLNRQNQNRQDATPRLSDIRESGAIEQDADLIMFVHPEDEIHRLIIAKNRHGEVGEVKMIMDGARSKFTEMNELEIANYTKHKKDNEKKGGF